jgi:hypothetical protein
LLSVNIARWEARLRREGLAPLDMRSRVVMPEVITPARLYVSEPMALAQALHAWLAYDHSHFDAHALKLLAARNGRRSSKRWPRRRAQILAAICEGLADGLSVHGAAKRVCRVVHADDLAFKYLPMLARHLLSEKSCTGDDADEP